MKRIIDQFLLQRCQNKHYEQGYNIFIKIFYFQGAESSQKLGYFSLMKYFRFTVRDQLFVYILLINSCRLGSQACKVNGGGGEKQSVIKKKDIEMMVGFAKKMCHISIIYTIEIEALLKSRALFGDFSLFWYDLGCRQNGVFRL